MNRSNAGKQSSHTKFRTRSLHGGAVLLLAVVLVASSALAGITPLPGPVSSPVAHGGTGESDEDSTSDPSPVGALTSDPWWVAWLEHHDSTGSQVDDRAEALAREHLEAGRGDEPVSVLLTYREPPTPEDTARLVQAHGADPKTLHVLSTTPTVIAAFPAEQIHGLGAIPGVVAVEWDEPLQRMLTVSAPATQAREFPGGGANTVYNGRTAEALGYTGAGSVVAVVDTGVQTTHPAFAGKLIATADSSTLATVECTVSHDIDGHGTHVASTAIGDPSGNNHKGTAMGAGLVDIQISKQIITIGGVQRALNWVHQYNQAIDSGNPKCGVGLDDRIDVATVSFGSSDRGGPNAGSTETSINSLTDQGVVVTISVGNCGPEPSFLCDFGDIENGISSPGNAANAIGVAASSDANTVNRDNDFISTFSSRGPNSFACCTGNTNPGSAGGATGAQDLADRYRKPDITAPGVGISAANAFHVTGPDYFSMSGTSMSAPHVAGIAALLMEAGESVKSDTGNVNLMRPTGSSFSGDDYVVGNNPVRDAIMFSADYMTTNTPSSMLSKWEGPNAVGATWNNAWGYGHVDAFGAICWAWWNVLEPGGASVPAVVDQTCPVPGLNVDAGGPYEGTVGEPISFTGSATGGDEPYAFAWDFGDGSGATGAAVGHTYQEAGTYAVELTVTDDDGAVVTAATTASVSEPEPEPGEDPEPFVNITGPEDGASVEGNVTIQGIAGHNGDGGSGEAGGSFEGLSGNLVAGSGAGPLAEVTQQGTLSLEPGLNTLWFRGEEVAGAGAPNVEGLHEAWLLPDAPTGEAPVVHSGSDRVDSRVVLISPTLENDVRLGDGDPETLNEVTAEVHLATWSRASLRAFFHAEINAVKGDEILPLGSAVIDSFDVDDDPLVGRYVIPVVLGDGIDGAPINEDGDVALASGYSIQFVFWIEPVSSTIPVDLFFSVLYDAQDFDSHIQVPVSDRTGSPSVLLFEASPDSGETPLDVVFNGTVQAGMDPVDHVMIDPGDGSTLFNATLVDDSFHAEHTYMNPGTWTATATAVDAEGRTASRDATVVADEGEEPERQEAVYVQVDGGPEETADDTSSEGDWSSWELVHDFSGYDGGTEVTITAVYFNGTSESAPHAITVVIGEEEEDDPGDPKEEPQATVKITAPGPGAKVGPDFQANGTTENITGEPLNGPEGTASENPGEDQGATMPLLPADSKEPPEVDRFAIEILDHPAFATLEQELGEIPGYLGLAPALDGSRVLHAQFDGMPPTPLPEVDLPEGWSLEVTEVAWERAVLRDVVAIPTENSHSEDPPVPEQASGIGPGSRLHISGVPGSGLLSCTANFVWEDQDGNLYLGAAGHCWMPDGATSTHPPNADYTPPPQLTTQVCVASCAFGGQSGFFITGQFVTLGEVVYARQSGAGGDRANDFGLVRIPDQHRHLVRPEMPMWSGPDREQNPSTGSLLVHYGNGVAVGEAWPTMGRAGIATATSFNDWMGVHPSTFGDSGSALSLGVPQADTGVIVGEAAAGVITHISCCPGTAGGPTISRVKILAEQADLEIRLVTAPPSPPTAPRALAVEPGNEGVELSWDEPAWNGGASIQGYTVYWGTEEGGPYPESATTADTGKTLSGLENDQTYYFVVTASNAHGEGPASAEQTAQPDLDVVVEVRLVNDTGTIVDWVEVDHYYGSFWFHDFTDAPAGPTTLEVRLLEDGLPVSEDHVNFTVEVANRPPELDSIGDRSVVERESLEFMVSASDPDGDSVVLSAQPLPEGAAFTDHGNDTGTFDWTPEVGQSGEYEVTFSAFDGEFFDNETIVIVVDGKEVHPFVGITSPEDGASVEGSVTIEGIAGHNGADDESDGTDSLGAPAGGTMFLSGQASASDMMQGDSLSLEPGLNTLWFRGEEVAGSGAPNVDGLHEAWLLPEAPTRDVPVIHSGSNNLLLDSRIVLTSPPLASEVLLGDGDPDTVDQALVEVHVATWSKASLRAFFHAELNAVKDGESIPLGSAVIDSFDLEEDPLVDLYEIPVVLGDGIDGAPVNDDGDLVVSEGYNLEFVFWIEPVQTTVPVALLFSTFYDAHDFDSHIVLPVSDQTGSPSISVFEVSPAMGDLPLDVTFSGTVQSGASEVEKVVVDPGDGSAPMNATLTDNTFQAVHTYREEGVWNATATVIDADGQTASQTTSVTVSLDEGVYLEIDGRPREKAVDTSTGGDWSSWEFVHDFGGYANGTEVTIEAVYFDGVNESQPHAITVIVGPDQDPGEPDEEPEAVIHGPEQVRRHENATFDGSASHGNVVAWSWDFDDGTIAEGAVVEHAWSQPGPKTVMLTVRDAAGSEDTTTHRVVVQGGPPS